MTTTPTIRRVPVWCLLPLAGCTSEFITGGTPEQRALVESVFQTFQEQTRQHLEVKSIRLRERSFGGRYNSVTTGIVLNSTVDGFDLETIATHEFCHALDFQAGFESSGHPAWEADPAVASSTRTNRREGFAMLCEERASSVLAVAPCGTSELYGEVQRLQGLYAMSAPLRLDRRTTGQTVLPEGETFRGAAATTGGGVTLFSDTITQTFHLDGRPEGPEDDLGSINRPDEPVDVESLLERPFPEAALLFEDGDLTATACLDGDDSLLRGSDDSLWWARADGRSVSWGTLTAP